MFDQLKNIDRELLLTINDLNSPWLDAVMWQLSSSWHTILLLILFAYYFSKKIGKQILLPFVFSVILTFTFTDLSTNIVKHRVKRYRPTHNLQIKNNIHKVNNYEGGKYSFYSAHAANVFGQATLIFLCALWLPLHLRILIFIYPILVVYSRMYLGVHYPSDIVFGAIVGVLTGLAIFQLFKKYIISKKIGNEFF
ncbi:MAG: phosphatase PAP2 family protein [Bacteroidetes bacterium]|nr:phosphatase PAP2 family protein [Bacteroidota bacterium]